MKPLGDFTTSRRVVPLTVLAAAIGAFSACVAVALSRMIAFCTNLFFFHRFGLDARSPADHRLGVAVVLVPVVGASIIGLMARFGSEKIRGHGIPEAIEAILMRGSRVQPRVAFLKPIASAISIGSGGPFGAEGPIIMTGGAFGSLVGQLFSVTAAERKTLLVAGAAAGMSATFDTPLAAVLLAIELLLFEWKPRSLVPVGVASVTAAWVRPALLGHGPVFAITMHTPTLGTSLALCCLGCGLVAGAASIGLTKGVYFFEDLFGKLPIHWMWWPALGGLVVGLGGLIEPRALGVGYDVIESLLGGSLFGRALLVLMLVKAFIWMVSLGSGTSGGVLAPLLIVGASLGGLESTVLPEVGPGFWALLGMAAMLGGTMRAPLAAVVFALELTHDWGVVLPLLLTVPVSYACTVLSLRRSILTEKVSRHGFHLSCEYETDPLEILFVREVMRTRISALPASVTREELAASSLESNRPLFYVVDTEAKLVGVVTRPNLEAWRAERGPGTLGDAAQAAVVANAHEPLAVMVSRMATTGRTWLPVLDETRLVGEISLADTLSARVRHLEEEQRRERILPLRLVVPAWLRR